MATEWLNVSDVTPRIAYTATSGQTAFPVPFVFFEDRDLKVYKNGVLLTLGNNYTVSGAEQESGGNVTLTVGATAGDVILIMRVLEIVQTTHIPPSGPLDIPAVNIQISKLIAIDQYLRFLIDRSIIVAPEDPTPTTPLPNAAARALKYLIFDSLGNPAVGNPSGLTTPVSTAMAPVVAASTIAIARALLGIALNVGIRERLAASRAYYVNSDPVTGSDSNDGLSPGSPFLTMQYASNLIQSNLDLNGYAVDVYCAESTTAYAPLLVQGGYTGDTGGLVTFHGSLPRTITNATNATPIVITTSAPHNLINGDHVIIYGVGGNVAANGAHKIGSVTATTFALLKEVDGSNVASSGAYTSGGLVSAPRKCVVSGGAAAAFKAIHGAQFGWQGFSVTSSVQNIISQEGASRIVTVGPVDIGASGADQLYATRKGYIELAFPFSVSGGSTGGGFAGPSHTGEVRKVAMGYFTAAVSYAVGSAFINIDAGEYIETTVGNALNAITAATNATPVVITTTNPHLVNNGDIVLVEFCAGNLGANGAWRASAVTSTTITLVHPDTGANSVGTGAYTGSGQLVGAGFTWNRNGFTLGASIAEYTTINPSTIQVIGLNPPMANYLPGDTGGIVNQGTTGNQSGTFQSLPGNSFTVISGALNGFLVNDPSNTTPFFQVLGNGDSKFYGKVGFGGLTPVAWSFVSFPASTTAQAALSFTQGVDPTAPTNGSMWWDGSNLKFRNGGVTRTINWT